MRGFILLLTHAKKNKLVGVKVHTKFEHDRPLSTSKSLPRYSQGNIFNTPSLCTCYVLSATVATWMATGHILGRRGEAIHQRRPLVNRSRGCRDIRLSRA